MMQRSTNLLIILITILFTAEATKKNTFNNDEIKQNRKDPSHHTIFDEFMVYFNPQCLQDKLNEREYNEHKRGQFTVEHVKDEIIREFIDEYSCFFQDKKIKDEFENIGDYWILVKKKKNCVDDDDEKEIEWDDYCIKQVDEDELEEVDLNYFNNICSTRNVEGALWNLDKTSIYKSSGLEYIRFDSDFDPQMDIVIMDSGVDSTHSQFSGITYKLLYDAYPNHITYPFHDHGTHCAGTVLGNTYGVFKAQSSKIKLLDVRVLFKRSSDGKGVGHSWAIINGYNAIIDYLNHNNRKVVINMSFGGGNTNEKNTILTNIRNAGGISIAAAGNSNVNAAGHSPASSSNTITVGAHDQNGNKASFSNYGATVDIWAPGVSIKSAVRGGGSSSWQGTSMAAPLITGIAASMLASDFDLSFDEIKTALKNYAVFDLNDENGLTDEPRAKISCSEYCTVDHNPSFDSRKSYPAMDCWQSSSYENGWDADLTAENTNRLYFNGLYSEHNNYREDRLFRFRYCKPSGVTVSTTDEDVILPYTDYDAPWYRGCAVNSAITQAKSHHDNGREDRQWQFRCTPLPDNYLLTECKWSINYLNNWDGILNYNCPNNGLIRNIYSYHDNYREDRRFKFECCRVANKPSSVGYNSMDCWQSSSYENSWDAPLTAENTNRLYFNGLYSEHNNYREDRLFRFRYCKPSGVSVSTSASITLPYTDYDDEWYRGCGGNSAITRAKSHHDNGREDRQWQFRCNSLPISHRVTKCEWTGYLNNWDAVLNFNCLNNGLIRNIYSRHDNDREDRRYRFECCGVVANSYSYTNMLTTKDSNYVNNWDGNHDIGNPSYYLCGQESYHDNGREDRRFKWKRCRPSSGNAWQATQALSQTDWDAEWSKTCACLNDGNAAMVKGSSYHDNGREDRVWTFSCGILTNSYKLVNCGWSGYVNNWDGPLNFDCPSNGVIRSIWSKHNNVREDRLWRFECCQFASNNDVGFSAKISPDINFQINDNMEDNNNINHKNDIFDEIFDVFNDIDGDKKVTRKYLLFVYLIGLLIVINLICIIIYWYNKRKSKISNKYKVISMVSSDGETDIENNL